ncbi:MAG TPA: right-handed parallel beta-helix repeat-containing protein [Pseudonocardiaceae bacterium]
MRLVLAATAVLLAGLTAAPASASASATVLHAAPDGTGARCSVAQPCSLTSAQQLARHGHDVTVLLANGTYRLDQPLRFGPADSEVSWAAAPGAHPVLSGGIRVSGWQQSSSGIWSANVPAGTNTRQVFVDGTPAPVAQASTKSLGLDLSGWGASGFSTSGATASWLSELAQRIGTSDVSGVQFVWNPAPPTDWEESECPVAAIGAGTVSMAQPCWNNLTNKAPTIFGGNSSNITPYSLAAGTPPTSIENAYPLLHPGQWYLDRPTHTLYYEPTADQQIANLDIEVPRLESLVQVTGTLANPVHDLSFTGLTFSTATWLQPSTNVGFAQVQANLNVTGANNQGECTFAAGAPGRCPWGAFSQPLANVSLTAAQHTSWLGDTFTDLGGIGLGLKYGSDDNLVRGSTFTNIASSAIWLGCAGDPNPATSTDPASAVIADCATDPASAHDHIGANEIMTGNTIDDNVIHDDAAGYTGAAGVTLLFTRHTTVSHNDIFNLPYDGITSGAWQGHPDAASWNNTGNINADNAITDNLFHNNMQSYGDGGDIYTEGHQGETVYNADGSINTAASYAGGTTITGNVYDTDTPNYSYAVAPDVGSQWITLTGNVEWNSHYSMSSHWPTAAAPYTRSFGNWYADPDDTPSSPGEYDNTAIPETPGPADLPLTVLANAGVRGGDGVVPASIYYAGASGQQELVAGNGFTRATRVAIGGVPADRIQYLSSGFLIADVPAGVSPTAPVTLLPAVTP